MTKCALCQKDIHTDHTEGELMKCLKHLSFYCSQVNEYVNHLRALQ